VTWDFLSVSLAVPSSINPVIRMIAGETASGNNFGDDTGMAVMGGQVKRKYLW
jgi:hypothetical protein